MDILFVNQAGESAYLPYVPADFEIGSGITSEEIETLTGILSIPKNRTLRTFDLTAMFPTKAYPWINKNANRQGWDYVQYFNEVIEQVETLTVYVVAPKGQTVLHMVCTLESFTYSLDRAGDIQYSLTVKEHRSADPKKVKKL